MYKKAVIFGWVLGFVVLFTFSVFAEELTITTYYPSPYGSYQDLNLARNFTLQGVPIDSDGPQIQWRTSSVGTDRHWNIDQLGDRLRFFTERNSDDGAGAERMTILESGAVGINTVIPGTYMLYVNGNLAVNGNADKPGGGVWGSLSDGRLKDKVRDFNYGLDKITELNPIRYHYKKDNPVGADYSREFVGFVAQDVQKIIPEAVRENDQGYLIVEGDLILWTMLNSIKELKTKNEVLEAKVKALEAQFESKGKR